MRSHIPGTQDNRERKAEQGYGQTAAGGGITNSGSGNTGYGSGLGNTSSGRDTGYGSTGNTGGGTGNTGSGNSGYGSGTGNTGSGRDAGYGSGNTGNTGSGLVPSNEEAGLTGRHGSGYSGHTGTGTGSGTGHDSTTGGSQGGAAAKLKAHLPGTKEYKAAHGKDTDTDITTGTGSGSHTGRDATTGMCVTASPSFIVTQSACNCVQRTCTAVLLMKATLLLRHSGILHCEEGTRSYSRFRFSFCGIPLTNAMFLILPCAALFTHPRPLLPPPHLVPWFPHSRLHQTVGPCLL